MVNAHPVIALPCTGLIIPISIDDIIRVAGAQGVAIARIGEAPKGFSGFRPGQGIALPTQRVITIPIIRYHIEITAKNDRLLGGKKGCCTLVQTLHPPELIIKFRAGCRIPVRQVNTGKMRPLNARFNIARLFIRIITRQASDDVINRKMAGNGDAIIAFLPMYGDIPAN